jgi:hypothetical protein
MNKSQIFMWMAVIAMIGTGLVHAIDAPHSFSEAAYKGWLFYANALGSVLALVGIFSRREWGWTLGLLIAAGSIVAYVASRTVGLPQIPAEPDAWLEPLGVAALLAEGLFVAMFVMRRHASRSSQLIVDFTPPSPPRRFSS